MKDIELQAERKAFEAWWDKDEGIDNAGPWTPDSPIQFGWAAWRAAVEADRAQRVPDVENLKDRLVAISSAVADSDDREAQAIIRTTLELLASTPTPAPAQQEPVNAVAYLDIGAGGYMDLGTDMSDEALSLLPKGRHMLVIAGTYGVDGYTAAQRQEQPQQERGPMTEESDDDKLVDRAIDDLVMQRYGIRKD